MKSKKNTKTQDTHYNNMCSPQYARSSNNLESSLTWKNNKSFRLHTHIQPIVLGNNQLIEEVQQSLCLTDRHLNMDQT